MLKSKWFKILAPVAMASLAIATVLALPIALGGLDGNTAGYAALHTIDTWLIQPTYAQSATVSSITTDVDTALTGFVPDYKTYIVYFLIAAGAFWVLVRSIRAGKSS